MNDVTLRTIAAKMLVEKHQPRTLEEACELGLRAGRAAAEIELNPKIDRAERALNKAAGYIDGLRKEVFDLPANTPESDIGIKHALRRNLRRTDGGPNGG